MLPDLLSENLRVVICGTAAGDRSARLERYYAGRGNKFWRMLFEVGLTSVQLSPAEYERLLDHGIGLTDLVKKKSGMDYTLRASDFGNSDLVKKIEKFAPRFLCFNGKRAAKAFLLKKSVDYGLQPEKIGRTNIFIAPSTSGAANKWWDIDIWQELAKYCSEVYYQK